MPEMGTSMNESFNTIGSNLADFFGNEELSDIWIVFGAERFPAHRIVLAQKSLVLRQLFKDHPNKTELRFNGSTVEAVKAFVRFIYNGNYIWNYDVKTAINVIHLTQQFQVFDLGLLVAEEMTALIDKKSFIKVENFSEILKMAEILKSRKITEKVKEFGAENMDQILNHEFIIFESVDRIERILSALKPPQIRVIMALTTDVIRLSQRRREDFEVFINPNNCSIDELIELYKTGMFADKDLLGIVQSKAKQIGAIV